MEENKDPFEFMDIMKENKKPWYTSKTKWAGILAGVGLIIPGVVAWLQGGAIPLVDLWAGVVAILAVFGVRDLPVLNK